MPLKAPKKPNPLKDIADKISKTTGKPLDVSKTKQPFEGSPRRPKTPPSK
jgi:hypothetical protein